MKNLFSILLVGLICLSAFCQKNKSNYFDNKIQNISYQHWTAGVRGGGSGTGFSIEFKDNLPENIILEQLYFRNNKTKIVLFRDKTYIANFTGKANSREEEIPLEYDSQTKPVTIKLPFPIKNDEAILEYTYNNQKRYFKITNAKEIPALEYPQARPRD